MSERMKQGRNEIKKTLEEIRKLQDKLDKIAEWNYRIRRQK